MADEPNIKSCTVALPKECNSATNQTNMAIDATVNATDHETDNLSALAARVLERNKKNQQRNYNATNELQSKKIVALDLKQQELKDLIEVIGLHYGATEREIEEEFTEVLQHYFLDDCLFCYRSVAKKLQNNLSTKK